MDASIANDFLDACNRAFGFLTTDHGFRPGALEINQEIHFAFVSFVGTHVAVECVFDQNESWVEVRIARVVNGARPVDYATDSTGRRVREGLYSLLIRRGVRGFGPRDEGLWKKPLAEIFRFLLSKDADLLRRHGADILGDSPAVLDA